MHYIEPHYHWRGYYTAEEDPQSPFYGRVYSEFEFEHKIYNYVIHPQWDSIGSETLFIKMLFCDYEESFAIIELIGEWNDAIENDIMTLKRDVIDCLIQEGIDKFILIAENVLNFHASDEHYYEEWVEDIENGWVAFINLHEHVKAEMQEVNIDQYFILGGKLDEVVWRSFQPHQVFRFISKIIEQRLDY